MTTYSITAPNGQTYQIEGPPGASAAQVAQAVLAQNPAAGQPPSKERTWGEAATDIGASAVSGLGSLVQLPGQLYGLTTGDMSKTGTLGLGEDIQKYGEEMKSTGLKAREAERGRKVAAAEEKGQGSAFVTSFAETIKDPALLTSFLAEQIPQLLVPGAGAGIAGRAALKKGLAAGIEKAAAETAAIKAGTQAAVGVGAVQQGADVGSQAYEDIYKKLLAEKKSPEEAAGIAINLARAAGVSGAVISLLAQRLPGAKTLEKALAGEKGLSGMLVGAGKGALGESLSEAVEEGGGKFTQNLAMREVDPTQALMQGVGATAGQAAVGGVGMGGGAGAISGLRGEAPVQVPVPGQPAGSPSTLEAEMQAKRQALQQEQMGVTQGQAARAGEKMLNEEAKAQAQQEQAARAEAEKAAADQLAAARTQREAELKSAFPADYSDVMARTNSYAELFKEKTSLDGQRKTPEIRARLTTINGLMQGIVEEDSRVPLEFQRMQKENAAIVKQLPPDLQAKYAASAFTPIVPQQVEMREATVAQPPVQQTNLLGQPTTPEAAPAAVTEPKLKTVQTREEAEAALQAQRNADIRAAQAERKAAREAGQTGLFTRVGTPSPESQTTSQQEEQPVPEPVLRAKPTPQTVPTVVTPDVLGVLGIGHSAVLRKADHAIQGLDIAKPEDAAQVKQMLTVYRSKPGLSAPIAEKVDAYLARPEFEGVPDVTPPAAQNKPKPRPEPRASEPSVGVPVEPTAPVVSEPGSGIPPTAGEPAAPIGRGLVPTEQPAAQGNAPEGAKPTAVTAEDLHTQVRALETERQTLLTKAGRVPAVNSKARAKWDTLGEQIAKKKEERDTLDRTERAAKKTNEAPATPPAQVSKPAPAPAVAPKVKAQPAAAPAKVVAPKKEVAKVEPKKSTEIKTTHRVTYDGKPATVTIIRMAEDLTKIDGVTVKVDGDRFAMVNLGKQGVVSDEKMLDNLVDTDIIDAKVEPKKETAKPDKALVKARETADDLNLDPETTKGKVKTFAKKLHKAGLIDDRDLSTIENISKDRDMGPEDILSEIESALSDYERNIGKLPAESKATTEEVAPEPQRKLLEGPVNRLQDDQLEELEDFYGAKKGTPEFWDRLREDVTNFANKGAQSVAKAIRELIRQIQAGVLAVGLVFNPTAHLTNDYSVNIPRLFRTTVEVKAEVPAPAKAKMSTLAQGVYEAMAPVAEKTGKGFIIADKPNGMMHMFNADGSHFLSDPTLYGKEKGDVLGAVSSLEGGQKITPAGKFTLKARDSHYAGGKDLVLVESLDATGYIAIHAADVSTPSERRLERLASETIEDNRISYGCINTAHATFINKIAPHVAEFDGGLIFVLPDATEKTAEIFKPEAKTVEHEAPAEKAKGETARDLAKKEEKETPTEALQKPAADLNVAERTTSVEADLQARVAEGDIKGALQAILKAPEGTYTELDRAVARRILLTNKLPTVQVVAPGVLGMENGKVVGGQYNAMTDTVQLTDGYVGVHTLLHELVHGFVHRAIAMHEGGKISNSGIRNLRELFDYIGKHHPELADEYGMRDLSEFASEVMSNKKFQDALKKITYRRVNAFTAFAQSVLKALGLASTDKHSALAAAMISVDSIMTEGRKLQESMTGAQVEGALPGIANALVKELDPAARQSIKDIQSMFPPEDQSGVGGVLGEAVKGINNAREKTGIIAAFRQAVADKHASVEAKVSQLFSQGVRDYFGNLNPMVLVRQAEDSTKIVMDFFRTGGIRLSKDGLIETVKNPASMASALTKLNEFAKANDMTVDEAKNEVSTVLEGHRLHSIHVDHNKPLEASALILEQQGKLKEADAERAKKVDMHMSLQQIAQLEAIFQKSTGIKGILSDLNATKSQVIDLMVATGRIDKDKGQYWKDNEAYVPFNRIYEETGPVKVFRGKGLGVLTNIPGMKGSLGRPIKNVIDSYANRLGGMVEDTMKNHAAVKVLETMTMAGFANEVPTKDSAKNKGLVVSLYRDGKPVFFEVQNEYDMLAFQQAPEVINGLTKFMGATSRYLRLSITAMPPFAIKQVVEDAQRAAFFSGVKRPLVVAMKTLYNMPGVFFGEVTGRKSPMVRRMEALGIGGDYDFNILEPVNEIEKELGSIKRGAGEKLFHRLEQFTKASDLAARLAVFEETLRDTKSAEHPNGDELLAQTRARELINFSRRGSSSAMRTAARVIPFFNAYAQGMDVLYRSATGLDSSSSMHRAAARKMFMSRVAMMTALGFVYALSMSDDDGYKNATDDVRDNNWLLPNGYKISLPKELGFMFKSIPERIVGYYLRHGTDEEQTVMNALGSTFKGAISAYGSPNVTPSFIKPILENMTNYSFFLQRELESASLQKLEPGQRSTSSTSELAKALGESINVSPIKIDNLLRGMVGMAGSTTLLATDAVLNPTRPDRPLYQLPFFNLFLYDTIGGRAKNEFYQLQEKVSQAHDTYKHLEQNDPEKAGEYLEKNAALISAAPMINNSLKTLSDLRRMRAMYEQGTEEMLGMTGTERRESIDELRTAENESLRYVRELSKSLADEE